MNDPKYANPYPPQGYYQGPPVMAPPQYAAPLPQQAQKQTAWRRCVAAVCWTSVAVIPPLFSSPSFLDRTFDSVHPSIYVACYLYFNSVRFHISNFIVSLFVVTGLRSQH
ncbi:hypothetical protein V2J09_010789 [Rumex salicifolius]